MEAQIPIEEFRQAISGALTPEAETEALQNYLRDSKRGKWLVPFLANERRQLRAEVESLKSERAELQRRLEAGPWTLARIVAERGGDVVEVAVQNQGRLILPLPPGTDRTKVGCGQPVFLNSLRNAILRFAPDDLCPIGSVASFSRWQGDRIVLRGPAEEEIALHVGPALNPADLKPGDRVLFDREFGFAFEKVESEHRAVALLEEIAETVDISQLGGLSDIFREILDCVSLHLLQPELGRRYGLERVGSVTLDGPAGVGKTSLVKALIRRLREIARADIRLLQVKASVHRSKWYGETEERIRGIGAEVREHLTNTDRYVVLLFDDFDQIGSRDHLDSVDQRIIPAFLHEIDAMRALDRLLLVGCSNRPDLIDSALRRSGRFGDRCFRVPRPGTPAAVRAILGCYLTDSLPYCCNGHGPKEAAKSHIDDALSAMFAPNGAFAKLATIQFRDGSTRPVSPSMVMSGALLRNAVNRAKGGAALREAGGAEPGISSSDVLGALAAEFEAAVAGLKPGPGIHHLLDIPADMDVVRVEAADFGLSADLREYLRSAVN